MIYADVANYGYDDQNDLEVVLRANAADGEILDTFSLSSLEARSIQKVSFEVAALRGEGFADVYYVQVRNMTEDDNHGNDNDFISLNRTDADHEHVFTSNMIAVSCEERGCTLYECSVCGYSYEEDVVPALGHDWVVNEELSNAATCTEDGRYVAACSRCGEEKDEVLPATGHQTELRNVVEATDDEAGYSGDEYCTVCGELIHAGHTVPKRKVIISTISQVQGSDESVGLLTGGGKIARGTETAVSASAVDGYAFLGWYRNGSRVSGNYVYGFTADDDMLLTAVYEATGVGTLTVQNANISVNGEAQQGGTYSGQFPYGTRITLIFTGTDFVRWCNESNMTESTSASFTFTLMRSLTLTAVSNEGSGGNEGTGYTAYVEFVSADRQVILAETWNSADAPDAHVLPVGPSRTGKSFACWSLDGERESGVADVLAAITAETRHLVLRPLYTDSGKQCTVQMNADGALQSWSAAKGSTFTAYAPMIDGKRLVHWTDENGTVLSTQNPYRLLVSGDIYLNAVYGDENETTEPEAVLAFTGLEAFSDGGAHKIAFRVTRSLPEGYTLNQLMMLVSDDPAYGQVGAEDSMLAGRGIPQAVATVTGTSGTLTVNKKVSDDNTRVYARGYMLVTDPNGRRIEIYTPIVSTSYATLAG